MPSASELARAYRHPRRYARIYFNPNHEPAGSPEGGQFAPAGSQEGERLPSVVYRGAGVGNLDTSADFPDGVYVSVSRTAAAQWGDAHEIQLHRSPKLLDITDWNGIGKAILSRIEGVRPSDLSQEDYQTMAGDAFIQMPRQLVDAVRKAGYNGVRLGQDAFLIGRLSDYGTVIKLAGYQRFAGIVTKIIREHPDWEHNAIIREYRRRIQGGVAR